MKNRVFLWSLLGVAVLVGAARLTSAAPQAIPPVPKALEKSLVDGGLPGVGPKIQFPEMEFDFGTVKPGEKVRHDFKVVNLGDEALEITDVRPSCGCTTAGSWTRIVQPNETGVIPIQLDTGRFKGDLTKTITVTSNDPVKKQVMLKLKGTIWEPIRLSANYVIFSSVLDPNVPESKSITISNQMGQPVEIGEPEMTSKTFSAKLKTLSPGREFELEVTTVPPLQDGTNRGTITMKTSNPDVPTLSLSVYATVLAAVQVIPPKIVLPTAEPKSPVKRYVTIVNRRAGDLVVSDLKTTVEGVEVSATEVQKGKRVTIALTFPVGFKLPESKKMSLLGKTNLPELPEFEVPFSYVQTP